MLRAMLRAMLCDTSLDSPARVSELFTYAAIALRDTCLAS